MNKPIRTMSLFCMALFLALMVNATYVQYVRANSLDENPQNRRVIDAAFSRDRGAIMVGRDAVAESVRSGDRFDYQRRYAKPFVYAPVTGFFSYYSQTGLEQTQNQVLSGDDPRLFVTRLVDLISNTSPKGGRVQTTIDPKVQQAAYDALSGIPGIQGSVVALEPSTGKVLAMVSLPTFDPNKLASHDLSAAQSTYDRLLADPGQPLLNRAIQTRLPPGSTFKIVTASAALEDGLYDDADSMVPGGPVYQLPQSTKKIDNGGRDCGTDKITMTQAIANSCNTSFLAIADELGHEKLQEQAEKFGFNRDYFDDLRPTAQSVYPKKADEPQTAMTGIGQFDVQATPLQMAMVAAGIANDGVVMRPYLVDQVLSPDLDVIDRTDPSELDRAVSESTAKQVNSMMVSTVTSGTASPAAIPGVEVAGKTGTAENCSDCKNYAWFISFAPANDPQVAVAVMIQGTNVPNEDIAGGQLGGPVAKAVMEAVIK
ncbi:MAG: penicillin-binding protein 2 [Nocardioides sp.]|uniref:peptidoglycan D,D-transpeptidase FtsI family protein n=1 Tax=Nocardioides sp. TaxID=35761 RepID=UPI0039E42A68